MVGPRARRPRRQRRCCLSRDRRSADVIDSEIERALTAVRARQPNDVGWHGGITLSTTEFLGAMVGELMVHGLDLARTVGKPWPMPRQDALAAVDFFNAATPYVIAPGAAAVTATIRVRYRGYDTATFSSEHGSLRVTPGSASRADVTLSVDPVAFLLIGYRRKRLGAAIATGKAVAWGRRPWLGLRFPSYFEAP